MIAWWIKGANILDIYKEHHSRIKPNRCWFYEIVEEKWNELLLPRLMSWSRCTRTFSNSGFIWKKIFKQFGHDFVSVLQRKMEKLYLIIVGFIASDISSLLCSSENNSVGEGAENISSLSVEECGVNETCVRFCCSIESNCISQEYFNLRNLPQAQFLNYKFKALRGKPNCSDMYVEKESWMLLQVNKHHLLFLIFLTRGDLWSFFKINKFLNWETLNIHEEFDKI